MEKKEELHEFKIDGKILKAEPPYLDDTNVVIPSTGWKKTYRKTDAIELTKIIKDTTLTQNSLIRITGSYSTKMLQNLSIDKGIISGIEQRPSKIFYNEKYSLEDAINNDMLSYIPYSINYLNTNKGNIEDKLYIDNIIIINKKLYFNIYLDEDVLITVKAVHLDQKNLLTGNVQTINGSKGYLKVFIADNYNYKHALINITSNIKEPFILLTVNKYFKKINITLYKDDTELALNKENLLTLKTVHLNYNDKDLYYEIKNKYEFERKIIK